MPRSSVYPLFTALSTACEIVSKQGMRRNAVIVITRGEKAWYRAIPELRAYGHLYQVRNKQNWTISAKNCPNGYASIAAIIENQL